MNRRTGARGGSPSPTEALDLEWLGVRYRLLPAVHAPLARWARAVTADRAISVATAVVRDGRTRMAFIALLRALGPWSGSSSHQGDQQLLALVGRELRAGRLLMFRTADLEMPVEPGSRRLSQEETVVRAALAGGEWVVFEGARLTLLDDARWKRLRGQEHLRILRKAQALPLLERLSRAPGLAESQRDAFQRAADLLVDALLPAHDGLVLARQVEARSAPAAPSEPALTPSQLVEKAPDEVLSIDLDHRYHDEGPISGAPFELTFADGTVMKGTLGANGKATVNGVPDSSAEVRFSPDQRAYTTIPQAKNPSYKPSMSAPDYDALIDKHWQAGS